MGALPPLLQTAPVVLVILPLVAILVFNLRRACRKVATILHDELEAPASHPRKQPAPHAADGESSHREDSGHRD